MMTKKARYEPRFLCAPVPGWRDDGKEHGYSVLADSELPDETLKFVAMVNGVAREMARAVLRGPPIESHHKGCTCGHERCGRIELGTMTYEEQA